MKVTKLVKHFIGSNSGSIAALEFAVLLPIFLILVIGGFEFNRYIVAKNKFQQASSNIVDYLSQQEALCNNEISRVASHAILPLVKYVKKGNQGVDLFTGYGGGCGRVPCQLWQQKHGGQQAGCEVPNYTVEGLPGGMVLAPGDNYIVYQNCRLYQPAMPIVNNFVTTFSPSNPLKMYSYAIFRPRNGDITSLTPYGQCN